MASDRHALWLAWRVVSKKILVYWAMENIDSFVTILEEHFVLDHSATLVLYSLSAGAGRKITGDESINKKC